MIYGIGNLIVPEAYRVVSHIPNFGDAAPPNSGICDTAGRLSQMLSDREVSFLPKESTSKNRIWERNWRLTPCEWGVELGKVYLFDLIENKRTFQRSIVIFSIICFIQKLCIISAFIPLRH